MCGISDSNGVQREHCNVCSDSVRLDNLGYEPASELYKYGRDICLSCTNKHPHIESIAPAKNWTAIHEE